MRRIGCNSNAITSFQGDFLICHIKNALSGQKIYNLRMWMTMRRTYHTFSDVDTGNGKLLIM